MKRLLFVVAIVLTAALTVNAVVYNLSDDWSDVINPNGVWSLYKSANALFVINQPDYFNNGQGQNAWADQVYPLDDHVPFWYKNDSDGVIHIHGAELDRTGSSVTFVRWTSPENGTAAISGAVWTITSYNRSMGWNLRSDSVNITGGELFSDGSQGAANPVLFSQGTGGAGVLTFSIQQGQTIDLVFTSLSQSGNLGESLALDLTITVIPEPATICLLGIGVLCVIRSKKNKGGLK